MRLTKALVRHLYLALFSITSTLATGQTIRFIDEDSQRPIADVFVFHESQQYASFSDKVGQADISEFPSTGKIIIQHPAYVKVETTKASIQSGNLVIAIKEKVIPHQGVTVSANRWQQNQNEVPNDILAIKKSDIDFGNSQTSADLLANSGQVFMQKSQLGGGSPSLRGFAANAVLLVVDGIRLNNGIYRSGNLQNIINVDPFIIEKTEVVFGPGSVIYGSDALGGVVDFRTQNPKWQYEGGTRFQANALARYSSASKEKTTHFDLSLSQEKVAYYGSISFTDLEDLRAGNRRSEKYEGFFERNFFAQRTENGDQLISNDDPQVQKFSGYNLLNVFQKIRWRTSERTEMTYSYFLSTTSDIPRYDRLSHPLSTTRDSLLNAEWYYGPQDWQMHALKFISYASNSLFDQVQLTTSFQNYEESRNDRRFGGEELRSQKEEVAIVTFNADFEKRQNKGVLYYGIDGFWNDIDSRAQLRNITTDVVSTTTSRYPNGGSKFYSGAAYASYKWNLSKKFILNSGFRYSVVRLTARNLDEDIAQVESENGTISNATLLERVNLTNQAITGSLGLVFNPGLQTKISGIVSSGFRAPNVDDIGKFFEIDDEAIVVPNTDLKPEYSYNQEIGIEQHFNDQLKIKIVGYHSWLIDAIVRDEIDFNGAETLSFEGDALALRSQVNAGRARIYGGSALLEVDLDKSWALSSSLSINEGRETESQQPLRHATPVFGRSAIKYRKGGFLSEFFIDYHAARSADNIPDSEIIDKSYLYTDSGSPAWSTINLRLGYTASKNLSVESGLENILDQHYRTYSSGISAPGRNFYLTVKGSL